MRYLLILIIVIPCFVWSQRPEDQIREMKNSVLLVRLKTSEKKIGAMREAGMNEMADKTVEEQREENLAIARAFAENYNFTPVYFFYSNCSKNIMERNFGQCLMNEELEPVKVNPSLADKFFIAEFGYVEKEQMTYFSDYSFDLDTTGYRTKRKNYYGGTELGPDALVLRDANFRQLRQPFPFYIRTYEGFPLIRRSPAKAVRKLNEDLEEFYEKVR